MSPSVTSPAIAADGAQASRRSAAQRPARLRSVMTRSPEVRPRPCWHATSEPAGAGVRDRVRVTSDHAAGGPRDRRGSRGRARTGAQAIARACSAKCSTVAGLDRTGGAGSTAIPSKAQSSQQSCDEGGPGSAGCSPALEWQIGAWTPGITSWKPSDCTADARARPIPVRVRATRRTATRLRRSPSVIAAAIGVTGREPRSLVKGTGRGVVSQFEFSEDELSHPAFFWC